MLYTWANRRGRKSGVRLSSSVFWAIGALCAVCEVSAFGATYQFNVLGETGQSVDGQTIVNMDFSNLAINNLGQVAYQAAVSPAGAAIFIDQSAAVLRNATVDNRVVTAIARENTAGNLSLSDAGEVAFKATYFDLAAGFTKFGFFTQGRFLVGTGDVVDGMTLTSAGAGPVINSHGQIAYGATFLDGEGATNRGYFVHDELVIADGGMLVGEVIDETRAMFGVPGFNDQGQIAFYKSIDEIGRPGLFTNDGLVAQRGDAYGDDTLDLILESNSGVGPLHVPMNNAGQVAFEGRFELPPDEFGFQDIFFAVASQDDILVRLPDEPVGEVGVSGLPTLGDINNLGQVAYTASVSDEDFENSGAAILLGDEIVVTDSEFNPDSLIDGRAFNILGGTLRVNDRGDVAFVVQFTQSFNYAVVVGLRMEDSFVLGDMNGDGVVDAFDAAPFELALADRPAYAAAFPDINPDLNGDIDASGGLDAFDVSPFESLLAGGGMAAPEPGALGLFALLALLAPARRRR